MTFNAAKCHLLKITRKTKFLDTEYKIDNHTLLRVQHHPYLEVELTSDLTWKHHIGLITGKTQKILNLLRRHLYGCNPDVKKRAFTSLVLRDVIRSRQPAKISGNSSCHRRLLFFFNWKYHKFAES